MIDTDYQIVIKFQLAKLLHESDKDFSVITSQSFTIVEEDVNIHSNIKQLEKRSDFFTRVQDRIDDILYNVIRFHGELVL